MRRIYRWFTLLLPVILLVGACQPLLAPVARYPRLELQGHVSGATLTVAVQGDYAYLGFSYEFVVLDIADRRNPHWVAALPIFTNAIALAGGYAYVVGKGGFTVVNIADPTQPQLLASLGSQETAVGVVLAAGDAYFIEGRRLYQVDIADPTRPQVKQTIPLPSRAKHLATAGGYLYVSSYAGLHVFDLTAQAQAKDVCFIQTETDVSGVVVTSGYLLFASNSTLHVVDMATPTACHTVAAITMSGWVSDLAVANDILYVANGSHDLRVWDISDPQSPVAIGAYTTGGLALTVTVQDGYLYLVDCNEGLHIYAIADPAHLTAVGHFTPLGITVNLAVVGAHAYLTAGLPLHLHQLDLTAPAQIPIIQNRRTSAPIFDIVAVDERLYLLTAEALEIIDVTTPAKLFTVAVYPIAEPTLQNLWYVAANRTHAYLGDTVGNVWLVDLTTAPQPLKSPAYRGLGQVGAMALVDNYAYLPAPGVGVRILKMSATGTLTQVGLYATTETISKIAVAHGYAYLVGALGLSIVDVRAPGSPLLATRYPLPNVVHDLTIADNYAFLATGKAGLLVLEVTNPVQPVLVATFATPDCAHSIVYTNQQIYVADRLGGLYILVLVTAP